MTIMSIFGVDDISLIFFADLYEQRTYSIYIMLYRHTAINQTLCVRRSDMPIFLTDIRHFFNAWYLSTCVSTRKEDMNVSLHLAQQNSVQCIANLSHFLCITFSKRRRKPNGRRYFPNNRQHLAGVYFSFRRATTHEEQRTEGRKGVSGNACRCEFNYFRSQAQGSSLPYGSLTYRKHAEARMWNEKRRELCTNPHESYVLCSVRRDELSRSKMRCYSDSLRLKRNGLHRRESLFDEVEARNAP